MKKGKLQRRFFVAIFPPPAVVKQMERMAIKGPDHWRWNRTPDLHLSLAFPGGLSEKDIKRLKQTLGKVVHKAFNIAFEGIGFFLDNRNRVKKISEHVLWAKPDFRADNELKTLQREIMTALKDAGFSHGRDDYAPHMTLAKVEQTDVTLMKDFADVNGNIKSKGWLCSSFALYESLKKSSPNHPANNDDVGSKYKKIAEFKLSE